MTKTKLANIEKVFFMNTHPVLLDALPKKEALQIKLMTATYLKKTKEEKETFLRNYYQNIKKIYKEKLKVMKEFDAEKDLNKDLLTNWEE